MTNKAHRPRILIVDDIPDNIDVLGEILSDCRRIFALNGKSALKKAAADPRPDLILLDIMMPGMDGYETCRRLKSDPRTRHIPVIFITAKSGIRDEIKGFETGASDYITKPFSPPVVKARVKNHLEMQENREKLKKQNEELIEASRLREDVERIMRHDLKTPLNAIIGFPRILLSDRSFPKKYIGHIRQLEESGLKMLHMINLSMDLYKMERGIYSYDPKKIDAYRLIRQVIRDARDIQTGKNLSFRIRINGVEMGNDPFPKTSFWIQGDELLSFSMFSNLIMNAAEASPKAETIGIDLAEEAGAASIRIRNRGAVPEEIRDRFFDKYVTCGKKNGTGLGTYSARLIAETQGGTIRLKTSTETCDTEIHLTMPALAEPVPEIEPVLLSPDHITGLPNTMISRLNAALKEGDPLVVENRIQEIRSADEKVGEMLEKLADDYEYEKILSVIRQTALRH